MVPRDHAFCLQKWTVQVATKKMKASVFATPVGSGGAFKLVLMIVAQVAKHHRVELPGQLLAFEGLAL